MTGRIVKALSGFYYVDCDGEIIQCKPRGKFRYEKVSPLVGDRVDITPTEPGKGRLDTIHPRKNQFQRPAVANMDQMIVIASQAIPVTDPFLIDRVAAIAELKDCEPVVVLNKCDLNPAEELFQRYQATGIRTMQVSAETGEGLEELAACLHGKVSVFTGNSGVGKSSLLNALDERFQIETGEISKKLKRGKHTTRHSQVIPVEKNTFLVDTPGFSSLYLTDMKEEELRDYFPEFVMYEPQCRFQGCMHIHEPGCAVKKALSEGKISQQRYDNYLALYEELKEKRRY